MESSDRRKNRPRSQPTPRGKRTSITDNDIVDIFEPLARHAQLTTTQLIAFGRRHPVTTRKRLTDLYHEGAWLTRLSESLPLANALIRDEMYRLGPDAEALLIARGVIPAEPWVQASRIGGNSTAPSRIIRLAHDHMASDIALDIEIGARATPAVRFRSHIEIVMQAPARTRGLAKPLRVPVPPVAVAPRHVEPDALFAIGDRLYALEADTGTESITGVVKGKIIAWREIVAHYVVDEQFGFENLTVLFVTTNEARMRSIIAVIASIVKQGRSTLFLLKSTTVCLSNEQVPLSSNKTFNGEWLRAGYKPISFLDAR